MSFPNYPNDPPAYQPPQNKNGYERVPANDTGNIQLPSSPTSLRETWLEASEDDFKYGVTISESSVQIRQAFVRKVYAILSIQLLATVLVGCFVRTDSVLNWVSRHIWTFYLSMAGSFLTIFAVWWKQHSFPLNFIFLGLFTICEAIFLGISVAYLDQNIVLQAIAITTCVFISLTLFTLQSRYDFTGLGPYLMGGLMTILSMGLVSIVLPTNNTFDLIYSGLGCLLFSGYIVYDTSLILRRLTVDDFVMASLSLYLDIINLFLSILRALNTSNRD